MEKGLDPSAKREADALLTEICIHISDGTTLCMAERHNRWDLYRQLLGYVEAAGGRLSYQGPCTYAIEVP